MVVIPPGEYRAEIRLNKNRTFREEIMGFILPPPPPKNFESGRGGIIVCKAPLKVSKNSRARRVPRKYLFMVHYTPYNSPRPQTSRPSNDALKKSRARKVPLKLNI